MAGRNYIIVSPVRDESDHLGKTIASVAGQSVRPAQWIIVNDGSTDRTAEIIDAAAREYTWITPVHLGDRGFRKSGGGVIEAFYRGYEQKGVELWDYLVKLDGDLSFERDYFERCLGHFEADAKLGIGGGTTCVERDGRMVPETPGDVRFHVRGATKIYRRACWEQIGGLIKAPGWDTLDELKANMLGWMTCTFPDVPLIHHRPTGVADGTWKNWFKNGRANYIVGYHPLFMLAKCVKRSVQRPYGIAALALWSGFASGYLMRVNRIQDKELIRYLRRQQMRTMLLRKTLWNEPAPGPIRKQMAEV